MTSSSTRCPRRRPPPGEQRPGEPAQQDPPNDPKPSDPKPSDPKPSDPKEAVVHPEQEPTFLPLTASATRAAAARANRRDSAGLLCRRVAEADAAAAGCWVALLGGCGSPDRTMLPRRLRALAEATSAHVGSAWWSGHGSAHRRRVTEAQLRINDAVREGDGAEFAEAFVGYDQAVATAVVSVQTELESSTP